MSTVLLFSYPALTGKLLRPKNEGWSLFEGGWEIYTSTRHVIDPNEGLYLVSKRGVSPQVDIRCGLMGGGHWHDTGSYQQCWDIIITTPDIARTVIPKWVNVAPNFAVSLRPICFLSISTAVKCMSKTLFRVQVYTAWSTSTGHFKTCQIHRVSSQ